MFERYNEKARRAVFFSRYEASEFGCEYIEADFLLLGIAREAPELCVRWLDANYEQLRETVARLYMRHKSIPTTVDLPLANPSKRVLAYAAEEADRMGDTHIGPEHVFLGLLREDGTASRILKDRHENVKSVRAALAQETTQSEAKSTTPRAPRPGLPMQLVMEDGGEIAALQWTGHTPSIGESVVIPNDEGEEISYRVLDVCWRMRETESSSLWISEIQLTVRKERP